jgi:hypothetical protein
VVLEEWLMVLVVLIDLSIEFMVILTEEESISIFVFPSYLCFHMNDPRSVQASSLMNRIPPHPD